MKNEVVDTLSRFKVTDKPLEATWKKRGRHQDLVIALSNLANDKVIEIPVSTIGDFPVKSYVGRVKSAGKKVKLRIRSLLKNGSVYFWAEK